MNDGEYDCKSSSRLLTTTSIPLSTSLFVMSYDSVPMHPVPPRMLDGPEVPYIGPNIEAYRKAHADTVGENADKWWAKVNKILMFQHQWLIICLRWQGSCCIGTFPSRLYGQAALRTETSRGSRRAM